MIKPTTPISRPSGLLLLLILLLTLWIAGGSARADVLGQAITRGVSWLLLLIAVLFGVQPKTAHSRPCLLFMAAATVLASIQLVPLPPAMWHMLPGRTPFAEAAIVSNDWRPWTITPPATINAASALIVPIVALLLMTSLDKQGRRWLLPIILGLVFASTIVGLFQFSGVRFDNPLINDTPGSVSGTFANRNHFALFISLGCVLAPVWTFTEGGSRRRGLMATGLILIFTLTILASGSRAGILFGALALGIGLALSWHDLRLDLERCHAPRWMFAVLVAAIVGLIVTAIFISIGADRAASITRAFATDPGEEMRSRALPTVLAMIKTYFPAGTGFGSFDPVFRMHEPLELLGRTYFNHAHNDFLELVLEGGLPALCLLLAGLGWWMFASIRVWRVFADARYRTARLGSAILLLILIASLFDYPARTPMMMALVVIASVWLSEGSAAAQRSTLRQQKRPL